MSVADGECVTDGVVQQQSRGGTGGGGAGTVKLNRVRDCRRRIAMGYSVWRHSRSLQEYFLKTCLDRRTWETYDTQKILSRYVFSEGGLRIRKWVFPKNVFSNRGIKRKSLFV